MNGLTPYYHAARARAGARKGGQSAGTAEEVLFAGAEAARALAALASPTEQDLRAAARKFAAPRKLPPLANAQILAGARHAGIALTPAMKKLLSKSPVRGLSGVTVVTVLTKPYHCPGKCTYCPLEPGMPKSYISSEPGAQRAVANKFDPYLQVKRRIEALRANGHDVDKVELIVLGGTWSAYPKRYQTWFTKRCFDACNDVDGASGAGVDARGKDVGRPYVFTGKRHVSLPAAQLANETAAVKIIGLTVETRPDWIDREEIRRMRLLGVTRVQIGVQSLDDGILDLTQRGHGVAETVAATALLRSAGFKFDYHLMPNLPGSDSTKDLETYRLCFNDPRFVPDQVKIYPCIVNRFAPLYQWWKDGRWKEYATEELRRILEEMVFMTPPFVRINRLVRDIPEDAIDAGNKITNLRQSMEDDMRARGLRSRDLRWREARANVGNAADATPKERAYDAAGGRELFLSYESPDEETIYAFARLRLPAAKECWLPELKDANKKSAALIRELHVYGQMTPTGDEGTGAQHVGFGKKLMARAEAIAKKEGYAKMAVIAGIGTRNYYRKLGYELEGTYLVKSL